MKNNILFFLLFLGFISQLSAQKILRGTVVQQKNGVGIANASVYILGVDETKTDVNGSFALDWSKCTTCKSGTPLSIKVNSSHGFGEKTYNIANTNQVVNVEIPQNNKLIISGRVKDKKTGSFLEGIKVSPIIQGTQVSPQTTNAFGQFEFVFNKRNTGLGKNQAVNLAFRDADQGKYQDLEGYFPVSLPITAYLEECTNCGSSYDLEIARDRRTDIKIEKGDEVIIKASGTMTVGAFVGTSTPAGRTSGVAGMSLAGYNYPNFRSWNHAVLCYRFGSNDTWKYYDPQKENKYLVQSNGYLEFFVNDNNQNDNYGAYNVTVTIRR